MRSLLNRAARRSSLGENSQVMVDSKEAVSIARELVEADGTRQQPELANALHNWE
jgi:hypothetical protein